MNAAEARNARNDQKFLQQAHWQDDVTVRVAGSTSRVAIPFYYKPGAASGTFDIYISETSFNKLKPVIEAIENDDLWTHPALHRVLHGREAPVRDFLCTHSYWEEAGPDLSVKGEPYYFSNINSGSKGMLTAARLIAEVAHVLRTSPEPLEKERAFWAPYLADMVTEEPGLIRTVRNTLASAFRTGSVPHIAPGPERTLAEKLCYPPAAVQQTVGDVMEMVIENSEQWSEPDLRAISRGEYPPKFIEAVMAGLQKDNITPKSSLSSKPAAHGRRVFSATGAVVLKSDPAVEVSPVDGTAVSKVHKLKPGDRMADGTLFAGVSPETGRPMYTTPADAPDLHSWDGAMWCARLLKAHGHRDWRVPTSSELNVLFNNRAAIGGFNEGNGMDGEYWSSEFHTINYRGMQYFSTGKQDGRYRDCECSLRCVR